MTHNLHYTQIYRFSATLEPTHGIKFIYLQIIDAEHMKKIITILFMATALLTACQEEYLLNPAASLFTSTPELTDTTAIFRLAVANVKAGDKAITFPVRFEGNAERGVDYSVSADAFVFGGESPVDSIVVTTLNLGTEKTLSMTVSLPEGFEAGKYLTSEYTLHDKFAYISFSRNYSIVADSVDIGFELTDRIGRPTIHKDPVEVFMNVNKEKSTAEEGVDFEFSDSTRFVIRHGDRTGSLKIKTLKPVPEPGRDKIIFNLSFDDTFGSGSIQEIEVDLIEGKWHALDGVWKAHSLVTDSLYMQDYWKEECTGYAEIPEVMNLDDITLDLAAASFATSFISSYKYYFADNSAMRKGQIIDLKLPDGTSAPVLTFLLDNTNRYFTKNEKSEDTESYIGLRLIPGENEEEQLLSLYIIDHTSRSFMPELEAAGKYSPEKPVAASPGLYLNLVFNKE
jgi:hypothetical protein